MGQPVQHALLAGRVHGALNRCEGTDGRIARRNSRARVLAALRAVRSHLDAKYPAIVVRKKARHATPETIRRRAVRAGWVLSTGGYSVGLFAAAGVPIRRVPYSNSVDGYALYVPGWAAAIGAENQAQLRAAKKSKQLRDAALARALLLQGT